MKGAGPGQRPSQESFTACHSAKNASIAFELLFSCVNCAMIITMQHVMIILRISTLGAALGTKKAEHHSLSLE